MLLRNLKLSIFLLGSAVAALATTPVVTVTSPGSGASVGSPVNYVASATSSGCSKGIAAMRIYTASGVAAYTINSNKLNTNINLPVGSYNTVVQAWDNCGGVGKTTVSIQVSKIKLAPPKFLYATEYTAGKVAEYVVNPLTGSISATSQGATFAHFGPVDISSDNTGTHLYVANQGSHDLSAYIINRTSGNLTQVAGSPFALVGTGSRVAVHPSGKFVYVTSTSEKGGNFGINAFAVQSGGSLKAVPGSPFGEALAPNAIAIEPHGKYLYVSANGAKVGGFTIDETSGALTPMPGSPFPVATYAGCSVFCAESPIDLGVDPLGRYLYGTQTGEQAVAGFKIDPTTGSLTNLPGSPYPEQSFCTNASIVCNEPWKLSVDPSGKFIYVGDTDTNDFSIFKVNESTGVLSYAGASANTQGGICVPYTVNVDPSGTFVYNLGETQTQCQGGHAVLGFSINQGNGSLIPVPGSPFANTNVHTTLTSEERVVVTR